MSTGTCNARSPTNRLERSSVTGSAKTECRLEEQRSHVAPRDISSLPNELLAKIFSEGPPEVRRGTLPSIVTVSHVSRHWRVVSIGTPSLWARIHSDLSRTESFPLSVLDAYIQRSSTHPLDIVSGHNDGEPFFRMLLPHTYRWSSLVAYGFSVEGAYLISELHAPNLQRLCIFPASSFDRREFRAAWNGPLESPIPLFSGGAPRLTTVALDTYGLLGLHFADSCPSLKYFCFHRAKNDSSTSHILSLHSWLTHAKFLQTLVIQCWLLWIDETAPLPAAPTELPLLTRLEIYCRPQAVTSQGMREDYLSKVLWSLSTPSLTHLVLKGPGPPHQFDYLSSALQSGRLSYPGLRALTLHGHWGWPEYRVESDGTVVYDEDDNYWYYYDEVPMITVDLIRALPNITDVTLILNTEPISLVLRDLEDVALWPNLRTLAIDVRDRDDARWALPDPLPMTKKRVEAGNPIVHLTLTRHVGVEPAPYYMSHQKIV